MKKSLIVAAFLFVLGMASAFAQPRAVGVRLGYGIEFSYQHTLGNNMLSVDAGLPGFHGIEAAVTYDWINPFNTKIPWNQKGEWNWSLGVGGAGGFWFGKDYGYGFVGVAGRVGVEYNFWFPLQLSIEWRPAFGPTFGDGVRFYGGGLFAGGLAIGVRYKF
ncbi:MAG: hypothetical protein NC048_06640 [Bacteroides sp.]|nr:hypothetical protein [Ruminococcus flavefaciens]MCM1555156.1 hypothetical protein [Bacteroides sp.]